MIKPWHTYFVLALAPWFGAGGRALAATESLHWNTGKERNATCLYEEITVLNSIPGMYYCGAQFDHGYTGIQHWKDHDLHTALFSIWDTSKELPAKITEHDPKARPGRFGGEGEGAHVNLDGSWKVGQTYKLFLWKQPGKNPQTTDTRFYVISGGKWRHIATVNAPDGPKHEGEAFHLFSSWMENVGAQTEFDQSKIVLYDVWLGGSVGEMERLTRSGGKSGSGRWGQLHDKYFVAEGSQAQLNDAFSKLEKGYGKPVYGEDGKELPPLPDKPLPAKLIEELENLAG